MNGNAYSYCFLRYRQDPEAGEFANIGVALWAQQPRFLAFQGSDRYSRLTHFFGDLDRDGYRLLVAHVERRFDTLAARLAQDLVLEQHSENVGDIARQVVPEDDGSLVWSPTRGGVADDPSQEISRLFERYVGRHNRKDEKSRRDDAQVFRDVYRTAFAPDAVAQVLQEHEIVAPLASHTFKYAWKNGTWNVYETISFDMVEPESIERKAHTWFGRSMHFAESRDKPKLHYLLGKPTPDEDHLKAYSQAKDILISASNVQVIEEEEAADFARHLAAEVAKTA